MNTDWADIILNDKSDEKIWDTIYGHLAEMATQNSSPVKLHDETVIPDRILSEAAWELWEAFPGKAVKASAELINWTNQGPDRAVLILDALSLRELHLIINAANLRGINPIEIKVFGSECPSTTDQFAKALGVVSRSSLANDKKPKSLSLFSGDCYTDVLNIPFEDCGFPPVNNIVIWHSWLDDLIHLHKLPDQVSKRAASTLQDDGFWNFIDRLRKGRKLLITSDHGYAVSKRFSSEVEDPEAVKVLRETFGASRNKPANSSWVKRFMPPIVMTCNNQHVVMGQRKWKVSGGFPDICHGGMSLLEVAIPFVELPAL